jgi:hypothetical protein
MSWDVIVPVVVGGVLTVAGGFAATWWRSRREDEREQQRAARASLQAIRIVANELAEAHGLIKNAVEDGDWWPESRSFPTGSWNAYRDVIAGDPDPATWRMTADAFHALNEYNWRAELERDAYDDPGASPVLRETWRTLYRAMAALDARTGTRGVFGLTEYADVDEVERSIWRD